MKAVVMAGGKGTRLYDVTKDLIPKPMVPVNGKPILEWQLECLHRNGITEICIVIGHLGRKIRDYFGDGNKLGISITYYTETEPLGTAGALGYLREFLCEPYFLLVFGDVVFDIDIRRMEAFHKSKVSGAAGMNEVVLASLFVHPNSHPYDSDLVLMNQENRITGFDSKNNDREYWYDNIVNAGFYMLSSEVCDMVSMTGKTDLERDILQKGLTHGAGVYGYQSSEYIKDAGTVDRIRQVEEDITNGVVCAKNLSHKQRCIFLDRDGTLNEDRGLVYRPDDFVLIKTAAKAVTLINRSRFLAGVVTNQPVVARGLCGIGGVDEIHRKMKTLLGEEGAYLDFVEYCPHHPDKGYPEENPVYKIPCNCRKPGTGMIEKAARAMNIDVSASWMIGDTVRDIQTAKNAGMRSIMVKTGVTRDGLLPTVAPDVICDNILQAVEYILEVEN